MKYLPVLGTVLGITVLSVLENFGTVADTKILDFGPDLICLLTHFATSVNVSGFAWSEKSTVIQITDHKWHPKAQALITAQISLGERKRPQKQG